MGKTYVCADIHSHAKILTEALRFLDADDRLYMIGDAVDKGPDGMAALKILMEDARCEMLIGNHDLMMLENLMCVRHQSEIPPERLIEIHHRWQELNHGNISWDAFHAEEAAMQEKIISYLQERPLLKILTVNDRRFILVHAAVPKDFDTGQLRDLPLSYLQDLDHPFLYQWKSDFIWGRYVTIIDGYTVITGHTSAQFFDQEYVMQEGEDWYDIDCGLAYNLPSSKLALLCLDDMQVRYIPLFM